LSLEILAPFALGHLAKRSIQQIQWSLFFLDIFLLIKYYCLTINQTHMKRILLLSIVFSFAFALSSWAQRTVSGKVTDEGGEGLPGVNVVIKGTTTGVTTDLDGNYKISIADDNAILVFSSVGMTTQEMSVGARSIIDLGMSLDTKQLQEVVVTGYGTPQDLRRSVAAISSVSSQKIEQIPIGSFANILQGNAAGLLSSSGSGAPGTTGKVLIRGNSSINSSTDPLYILDGVPVESGTFATLNANDFATVTILKDASASAIYGSRAANGVIVITSKRGKAGAPTFQYRTQQGWSFKPQQKYVYDLMNTDQKIEWELLTGSGIANSLSSEGLDSLRQINTDWEDVIFRTANFSSHEISVSGGNEASRFFSSLSYYSQEGVSFSSKLDRYTFRLNSDINVTDKLRFGNSMTLGWSRENSIAVDGGANTNNPWAVLSLLNPYDQVRDPETGEFINGSGIARNPIAIAATHEDIRDETKVVASAYLEYDVIPNLTARTTWGVDYRSRRFSGLVPPGSLSGFPGPNSQGSLNRAFNRRPRFVGTNSLTYTKEFNNVHTITASVFHEIFYQKFENESATGYGLNRILLPGGTTPGNATTNSAFIPVFSGSERAEALLSYFGNVIYDYDGKYVLNLTLRRDGSSRFGADNRFANFWAVGLGWNVTEESFFNVAAIDKLKYRVSYGTTGNKNVGGTNYYPSLETYDVTRNYLGSTAQVANAPGNPGLKWETVTKFNTGIDFTLFSGRIDGSIDYYNELTSDAFITQQLSRTTGFASLNVNGGKIRNSGVEVQLNSDVYKTSDLIVNLYANLSYNKNEVVDLGQNDEFEQGTSIIREGLPIGTQFFPKYAGYNPANGEPLYYDLDGNVSNVFSENNSIANYGTSEAPYFGGFGSNITYKNFDLNIFFSYISDVVLFNNTRWFQVNQAFANSGALVEALDRWRQPGDEATYASVDYTLQFSSQFLEDASFLRLRNVTLAYRLPSNLVESTSILSGARVYLQGQNLLTWTKWTGLDPEASSNLQIFQNPQVRSVTIGVDVTF